LKQKGIWFFGGGLILFVLAVVLFFFAAIMFLGESGGTLGGRGDLAVVTVKGPIFESKEIVDQLDRVEKNDDIKGLILRIDSPGGAVGPSQEIYEAVKRLKKTKKVIATLGGVAASGGYYIAVAADKIVANPGTITGSIGVLMDYTNIEDLLGYLKIHAELITAGKLKDVGSPLRPLTPEDRAFLQSILDNMHQQFKTAVKEGRGFDQAKIDQIADGRIYTGQQALQIGLIDRLGNQQVAVDVAKEILELKDDPKLLYPKKKKMNILDLLLDGDLENRALKLFYSLREGRALYLTKGIFR